MSMRDFLLNDWMSEEEDDTNVMDMGDHWIIKIFGVGAGHQLMYLGMPEFYDDNDTNLEPLYHIEGTIMNQVRIQGSE